jgi:hypothetical protein
LAVPRYSITCIDDHNGRAELSGAIQKMPLSAEAIIALFGFVVTLPPTLCLLYRCQQRNTGQQDHTGMMQLTTDSVRSTTVNNAGISSNVRTTYKLPGHVALEAGGGHFLARFSSRSWARRQHIQCRSLG